MNILNKYPPYSGEYVKISYTLFTLVVRGTSGQASPDVKLTSDVRSLDEVDEVV